jgi:hypothetical protein
LDDGGAYGVERELNAAFQPFCYCISQCANFVHIVESLWIESGELLAEKHEQRNKSLVVVYFFLFHHARHLRQDKLQNFAANLKVIFRGGKTWRANREQEAAQKNENKNGAKPVASRSTLIDLSARQKAVNI